MSQTKSPLFTDVVDGVRLAQNITASQTAEQLDTFERITSSELVSYQRSVKIAAPSQAKLSSTSHVASQDCLCARSFAKKVL